MPSNSGGRKSGKISDKVGMDEKSNIPIPSPQDFRPRGIAGPQSAAQQTARGRVDRNADTRRRLRTRVCRGERAGPGTVPPPPRWPCAETPHRSPQDRPPVARTLMMLSKKDRTADRGSRIRPNCGARPSRTLFSKRDVRRQERSAVTPDSGPGPMPSG